MALHKPTLKNDLLAMMNNAKQHGWTAEQVATAMSDAIDRYVRGAEVVDVRIAIGSTIHDQRGKGKLQ
jgi:hypothetical protein